MVTKTMTPTSGIRKTYDLDLGTETTGTGDNKPMRADGSNATSGTSFVISSYRFKKRSPFSVRVYTRESGSVIIRVLDIRNFKYSLIWVKDKEDPYISRVLVARPPVATRRMFEAISTLLRYFIAHFPPNRPEP